MANVVDRRRQLLSKRPSPQYDPVDNFSKNLLCPIEWVGFKDPVIAMDGYTYERLPLHRWFNLSQNTRACPLSPLTGERLESRTILANVCIAAMAVAWSTEEDPLPKLTALSKCPLTKLKFEDPVVAYDGHSYERDRIRRFFRFDDNDKQFPISPATKLPMYSKSLVPNLTLRKVVQELDGLKEVDCGAGRLSQNAVIDSYDLGSMAAVLFEY
ncbi:hypothetical protein BDR26DRAFT_917025 [Obelidium mucronatum]|nr:hypothetical protein BDR26DRAFT_917025 [Obelidium mucronatum]